MGRKKLQGPCVVYETLADMKYRSVTEIGLNKVRAGETNIPNLKLGDILCHNCYMKRVEWDQYEKQKPKVKKQSNYDFTYQPSNKNRITMSQKNYESLLKKVNEVEELQEHVTQLEVALEQALS